MQKALTAAFTTFVVFLIVLPVPPTSIIGFALIATPKTQKYLHPSALVFIRGFQTKTGQVLVTVSTVIVKSQEKKKLSRL